MVFHLSFAVEKDVDSRVLKPQIFRLLNDYGAIYTAEYNVSHLYQVDQSLVDHYRRLDLVTNLNSDFGKIQN